MNAPERSSNVNGPTGMSQRPGRRESSGGRDIGKNASSRDRAGFRRRALVSAIAVAYSPLTFLGYGTDIDVAGLRAAGASIRELSYSASRRPGALPHELLVAVLDAVHPTLINIATLVCALVVLDSAASIVRRVRGDTTADLWVIALIAANPFFISAATSTVDHVLAAALLLVGLRAGLAGRPVLAGLLWGVAIGTRIGLVAPVLLGALVLARSQASPRWRQGSTALVAAVVGCLLYIPAWRSAGSMRFLENPDFAFAGWTLSAGRWAVKNQLLVGLPVVVVLTVNWRHVIGAAKAALHSPATRVAATMFIALEGIFFWFPWKVGHLIPALVFGAILLAAAPSARRRRESFVFGLIVALQLLWGCFAVRGLVPDEPNAARGGHVQPAVVDGPLITDIRCRLDAMSHERREPHELASASWACTNRWWQVPDD